MTGKRLRKLFKAAQAEGKEYEWIVKFKGSGITLGLDNDTTWIDFPHMSEDDYECVTLNSSLGNFAGVYELLGALGIRCEGA